MINKRIAKIAAFTVGMTFALGVMATPAGAQTIAELQAQINALMAQLAALQGGGTGANTSYTFTQNLTVGATGGDVVSLQQFLVGGGYLNMPVGVSYGYFGPLTKAAVAKWQAANGVAPTLGYWGPISRAKANSMGGGTTGGTTTGGTTTGGGITTPGVEGTLTATLYPTPSSGTKVYEGDSRRAVMGVELEAKLSDVRVERMKIQIPSITYYREIATRIYVMDGSTVLASSDLNSNTVVKEGSDYFVTITGFNYVVRKDMKKVLTIAVDVYSGIDSQYTDGDTFTLTVPANGVRGVDGAGINLYAPTTAFSRSHTPTADLVDSAALAVSLNSGTPDTTQVICEGGTDSDECDGLELARFNFKADDDDVTVTDFVLDLVRGGVQTTASGTVAYLYDGSTVVGSATVAGTALGVMTATFSNIDWVVPAETTRTLSVRMDIVDAGLTATTFTASTDAADVTAENSIGSTVAATGSADGNTLTIRKVGPEVSLVSSSISTSGVPQSSGSTTLSTSTLTAIFKVRIKAVGGDLTLGTVASTTAPVFAKSGDNNSFGLYENGVMSDSNTATSTSYTISPCTAAVGSNGCILAEGSSVDIEVTVQVPGREAGSAVLTSAIYSVGLEGIQWFNATTGAVQSTDFMAGDTDWRTSTVSFP